MCMPHMKQVFRPLPSPIQPPPPPNPGGRDRTPPPPPKHITQNASHTSGAQGAQIGLETPSPLIGQPLYYGTGDQAARD